MPARSGLFAAQCCLALAVAGGPATAQVEPVSAFAPPRTGFTVHWDFFASAQEAERLVAYALDNGAEVLNVVPPPHIWEDPASLAILRRIFALTAERGAGVVLSRIDGSSLADARGERTAWLYSNVLTERGRLPSGRPTPAFFLATVGKPDYERWLREETVYYAENFTGEPNLMAFGVGVFNEPFVSQRGSLLCFDATTNSYEIAQYTPYAAALWRGDLQRRFSGDVSVLNHRYGTAFPSFDAVPMPANEHDRSFRDAGAAYLDFVSVINDWVVARMKECRSLWHARSRRPVPFVLQFSGYVPEKFEKGRPAFAALDIFDWMHRADALGLSVYTDCGYPDRGHASVAAMVNFARLGVLERKPVFVLEGGNECDGAILDSGELRFFATAARVLSPATVIYEFLKAGYADAFATSDGKLVGPGFRTRPAALAAVRAALREAKEASAAGETIFVLDEPPGARSDPAALAVRARLMRAAMRRTLTFVPEADLGALPGGSTLVVPSAARRAVVRQLLAPRGVVVRGAEDLPAPAKAQ
jgi:hypothetical protein